MGEMSFIAGWFPLWSIFAPVLVCRRWKNTSAATLVVFVPTTAATIIWFQIGNFWPWLLLYLFLCWLVCFAMSEVMKRRQARLKTQKTESGRSI